MYQCPDCGGNLKYDIPSQMLSCVYCNAKVNPYSVVKEMDAQQNEFFEAKVFSCPQCGGEVYSVDNEAASFCSYCGASAILTERISNEKCPNHIIPFKITKEDCKKAYKKALGKAYFAPKELKDPNYIDSFRGIYMPYWNYCVTQNGEVNIPAHKSHRSGDYIITDHFDLKGHLTSRFAGDVHDASANFYDEISEALAPYDMSDSVDFTPSFLSGFYADAADVHESMYEDEATEFTEKSNLNRICEGFSGGYSIEKEQKREFKQWPNAEVENIKSAMFPVWFLSYRNKDRVAYAAVNGQTGKVVADMPISPLKYIIGSLLLALPIFIILNFFAVFTPSILLGICSVILAITAIICNSEIKAIFKKEYNVGDIGIEWKQFGRKISKNNKKSKKNSSGASILTIVITLFVFMPFIFALLSKLPFIVHAVIAVIMICVFCSSVNQQMKIENMGIPVGLIFSIIASLASTMISFTNPVSDIWYYSGVIIILFAILINFIFIIKNYNRIAMRRLPQFDKKGGDDRAY